MFYNPEYDTFLQREEAAIHRPFNTFGRSIKDGECILVNGIVSIY